MPEGRAVSGSLRAVLTLLLGALLALGGAHLDLCACAPRAESGRACCAQRRAPPCCEASPPGAGERWRLACECGQFDLDVLPPGEHDALAPSPLAPASASPVQFPALARIGRPERFATAAPRAPPLRRHLLLSILLV